MYRAQNVAEQQNMTILIIVIFILVNIAHKDFSTVRVHFVPQQTFTIHQSRLDL